jgi:threonine/homoserine/homoserine lactone efflux protein
MLHAYVFALVGIALAQVSPGPNLFAVAGAGLGQGLRPALFIVVGIATGTVIWMVAAALGLGALLVLYPAILAAMKVIGGGYLCVLGVKAIRSSVKGGSPMIHGSRETRTALGAWRHGLLITLSNPKAALAYAAVAIFLFGSGLTALQVLGFAPLGCASALLIYGVYAVLFSTGPVRRIQARFARTTDALFGLAFGAIGARILADGVNEIVRR